MAGSRNIVFYPEHPSPEKTHHIETTALPVLQQEKPFAIEAFCNEFARDADGFFGKYVDKRFVVTGVAKKVGPDPHNKPSIQLSDAADGQTYALLIFPDDAHYQQVQEGDRVVVCGNYLVMCDLYGIVMKRCRLVAVEKP